MRKQAAFVLLCIIALISGCDPTPVNIDFPEGEVEGYRPVYANNFDSYLVQKEGVRPMKNVGKIILAGTTLFVNELYEGIHVIDNSDPAHPKQTGFISILGNAELSKKGDYLYANNNEDLITLKMTTSGEIEVTDRKQNVFPEQDGNSTYLTTAIPSGNYFECPDDSKGKVIRWEKTTINSPKCYK